MDRLLFSVVLVWVAVVICRVSAAEELGPMSYDVLTDTVKRLCDGHQDLCKLSIAQEVYNLPSPGMCGAKKDIPCTTQILHITNFSTYEHEKTTRPQVYMSGELHGDERVGPHAVVELAKILLESENPWVRRLVNTRSILLTPITNSIGFDRNTREENSIDPNRDYPIDQASSGCMKAIASRIANEIYRTHMIQLAITFHGGMEAIAMEWGTKSRVDMSKHKSPDDFALLQIGGGLSSYAGPVDHNGRPYPIGRMNDLVYPVEGGSTYFMLFEQRHTHTDNLIVEDWAYAGNWDPDSKREPCTPTTFGGYPASKTQYTDSMLRAVNILVETSDRKWPARFGTPENILSAQSGTGHVPRNVRLALMVTDLVEPYIQWTSVLQTGNRIEMKWEVGGAFEVDDTYVVLKIGNKIIKQSPSMSGSTRWSTKTYQDRAKLPFKTRFSTCFTVPAQFVDGSSGMLIVEARAKVDSKWAMTGLQDTVNPRGYTPQTHIVNARTNPAWDKSNSEFRIKGRLEWPSCPVEIRPIPPPRLRRRLQGQQLVEVFDNDDDTDSVTTTPQCDVSDSVLEDVDDSLDDIDDDTNQQGGDFTSSVPFSFVFSALAFVLFAAVAVYMWRSRNSATHQRLDTVAVDEGDS